MFSISVYSHESFQTGSRFIDPKFQMDSPVFGDMETLNRRKFFIL